MNELLQLIKEANEGDEEIIELFQRALDLFLALDSIAEKPLRDGLIKIGKFYFDASTPQLAEIFNISERSIQRITGATG